MTTTPYQIRSLGDSAVRNLIINGNMDFWQRGTSFGSLTAAGNQFGADRFAYRPLGGSVTSVSTLSQSTDVPTLTQSGFQSRFSTLLTVNTAQASFSTTSGVGLGYVLEGQDLAAIYGKKVRLQFWVKSSIAGTYSVGFENSGGTRSYTTTYTIATPNTWQKVTIDLQLDTTGTWNFDNTTGLTIYWVLGMGPTRSTSTLNTWQGTDTPAASTQTNFMATVGATFQLAQVALYPGNFDSTLSIPFLRAGRSIGHELQMCQRYYEKSYDVATAPGSVTNQGEHLCVITNLNTGTSIASDIKFKTSKRINPNISGTVNSYTSTGTLGSWTNTTAANVQTARVTGLIRSGEQGMTFSIPSSSATEVITEGHWTVDCEL